MSTQVCKKTLVLTKDGLPEAIKFTFANGAVHAVKMEDFPSDVRAHAEAHGFSQTLGDCYSGVKGDSDLAETLFLARLGTLATSWTKGERGGGLADADLAEALAQVTGKPLEEAQKAVAEGDKAWKDARR